MLERQCSGRAVVLEDARQQPACVGRHESDCDIVVSVLPNEREACRRRRERTQPILSLSLLNLLVTLPVSSPVAADEVSDHDWQVLRMGSRVGAVEVVNVDGVTYAARRASPPLEVGHVVVRHARWRTGLRLASRFAPYCSRELVLDRLPADDVELRLEADYLGIGVSVDGEMPGTPTCRIVEAAPFRPDRYTGASWLFAERLSAGLAPLGG